MLAFQYITYLLIYLQPSSANSEFLASLLDASTPFKLRRFPNFMKKNIRKVTLKVNTTSPAEINEGGIGFEFANIDIHVANAREQCRAESNHSTAILDSLTASYLWFYNFPKSETF